MTANIKFNLENATYSIDKNSNLLTILPVTGYKINSVTANTFIAGEKNDIPVTLASDGSKGTIDLSHHLYGTIYINGTTDIISTQTTGSQSTQITHLYEMQESELLKFATSSEKYYENGKNVEYDFTSFVNQIYRLPFKVDPKNYEPTSQILTGWFIINNLNVNHLLTRNILIDLGMIKINRPNDNGFDYNVENAVLHLPWIPPVKLDINDIIGKTIHITYNLSLERGVTNIIVNNENGIIANLTANLASSIELFSLYNNHNFGNSAKDIFDNNIRQAYITINYYKPIENMISYETREHGKLSDYKGYVKISNGILTGSMTDNEYNDIMSQLTEGIYINDTQQN